MAKELPYFKFEPSEWLEGEIQICSDESIACFINLCSAYWLKLGCISYAFALHKYFRKNKDVLQELLDNQIISLKDDKICISFLDRQLNEFQEISEKRSKAAEKRWKNKNPDANEMQMHNKSNAIREEETKQDEKKIDKINDSYYQEIIDVFNSVCFELPNAKLTDSRKKLINARVKDYSLEHIGIVFRKVVESDFLSGRKKDWKATFDWIMSKNNFVKILEDNYKNLNTEQQTNNTKYKSPHINTPNQSNRKRFG